MASELDCSVPSGCYFILHLKGFCCLLSVPLNGKHNLLRASGSCLCVQQKVGAFFTLQSNFLGALVINTVSRLHHCLQKRNSIQWSILSKKSTCDNDVSFLTIQHRFAEHLLCVRCFNSISVNKTVQESFLPTAYIPIAKHLR